ncbi:MAG: hypothetical protein M3Y37_03225 [Chloroflexota bacterium]|nr:hypothetical protein [Chloroflexota bacterium]
MTVYIVFGLVMLGVVVVSLLVTGNLAATFNERAKADLRAALEPLAAELDGTVDLENASIAGRYGGQITSAKVISAPGGMGRLFQTTYIEPAGGTPWTALVRRPKDENEEWERTFSGEPAALAPAIHQNLDGLLPYPGWFELTYDPEAGALRLTRAMQSRRDIPTLERFRLYLELLDRVAAENRRVQTDAEEGVAT